MNPFQSIGGNKPGKSRFDLSYRKMFAGAFGRLYPVFCEVAFPGDIWDIGARVLARMQPAIKPFLTRVDVTVHAFFVDEEGLWDGFAEHITGGEDGDDSSVSPYYDVNPFNASDRGAVGTLHDFMGFPILDGSERFRSNTAFRVNAIPIAAYNRVWNEYYRDQNLQAERLDDAASLNGAGTANDFALAIRNWKRDYFTSSLPFVQRGTPPAVGSLGSASWQLGTIGSASNMTQFDPPESLPYTAATQATLNNNTVDVTGFDINQLRLAVALQRWLERNARAGVRLSEFTKAHFGFGPEDSRLQRPEYIGGVKNPVVVSEVLQTTATDTGTSSQTPQGNLAGHGITVGGSRIGRYRVREFGVVLGLLSIMPQAHYHQGYHRQWHPMDRFDRYFPEFAHLGEQAVRNVELFPDDDRAVCEGTFGYQGRFDEHRVRQDMVCGLLRPGQSEDYWTSCRNFAATPTLNSSFIAVDPLGEDLMRPFAVSDEEPWIIECFNDLKVVRPMPAIAIPMLGD